MRVGIIRREPARGEKTLVLPGKGRPKKVLTSTDLPQALKIVIPEEILIGNPVFKWLKSWIPDKGIRG
jgi:hypothetical protein